MPKKYPSLYAIYYGNLFSIGFFSVSTSWTNCTFFFSFEFLRVFFFFIIHILFRKISTCNTFVTLWGGEIWLQRSHFLWVADKAVKAALVLWCLVYSEVSCVGKTIGRGNS